MLAVKVPRWEDVEDGKCKRQRRCVTANVIVLDNQGKWDIHNDRDLSRINNQVS